MGRQLTTTSQRERKQNRDKPSVIVNFLDLDTAKFKFLEPKASTHARYFIPIRYDNKSLYVIYEARTCPFDVSTSTKEKSEYKKQVP